jgi:hypothetical protein
VEFGITRTSSLPDPLPKSAFLAKRAKAKQHKGLLQQKLSDSNRSRAIMGFSHDHRKLAGSQLTAKDK